MAEQRWIVRVPYREPTFEARRPADSDEPFVARYEVTAPDAPAAIQKALAEFDGEATDSNVGWVREPILDAVDATPA